MHTIKLRNLAIGITSIYIMMRWQTLNSYKRDKKFEVLDLDKITSFSFSNVNHMNHNLFFVHAKMSEYIARIVFVWAFFT